MTLKNILGEKPAVNDDVDYSEEENNEVSFDEVGLAASSFTVEEKEKLIAGVTEQTMNSDLIDWQTIAENEFKGKYTGKDCIYEFLKLPISESLSLNIEASHTDAQASKVIETE